MSTPRGQQGPTDPSRIDLSLDLIGSESLQHVQNLVGALAGIQAQLAQLSSVIPEAQVAGAQGLASRVGASGVTEAGVSPNASHSHRVDTGVRDAAGQGGSYGSDQARADLVREQKLRDLGEAGPIDRYKDWRDQRRQGGSESFLDRQIAAYRAREDFQARRRTTTGQPAVSEYPSIHVAQDYDPPPVQGNPGSVGPSDGASLPPDAGGEVASGQGGGPERRRPEWLGAFRADPQRYERAQEAFRIPQYGEWTVQDKLNMVSDFFGRRAERRFETARSDQARERGVSVEQLDLDGVELPTQGSRLGRSSIALRMAADQSAAMTAISQHARMGYARGGALQQAGVQAGYERAGQINIPGTDIGITNPVDIIRGIFGGDSDGGGAATAEGIQQRINVQRLRMKGGIDGAQAEAIVGNLAARGWTGERGQNLAFDAIAPLVQQGLNPETTVEQMDRAIRNGNTSVEEFRETLENLGPSARAARMSVEEYQQSLTGFAEQAQANGGTFGQGMRTGRNLTEGMGISPQQAGQFYESPMIQGQAMAQGILPNEMGAMGANFMADSTYSAMELAMEASQGFRDMPYTDPKTGRKTSGEDRQIIQAASLVGMDRETFEKLWNNREQGSAAVAAQELIGGYEDTVDAVVTAENKTRGKKKDKLFGLPGTDKLARDDKRTYKDLHKTTKNQLETGRGMDSELTSWSEVEKQMQAMAPTDKEDKGEFNKRLKKIREMDDNDKRIKEARKLIEERVEATTAPEANENSVKVEFTGAAKRMFKVADEPEHKSNSRSGGKASAAELSTPSGMRRAIRDMYPSIKIP